MKLRLIFIQCCIFFSIAVNAQKKDIVGFWVFEGYYANGTIDLAKKSAQVIQSMSVTQDGKVTIRTKDALEIIARVKRNENAIKFSDFKVVHRKKYKNYFQVLKFTSMLKKATHFNILRQPVLILYSSKSKLAQFECYLD